MPTPTQSSSSSANGELPAELRIPKLAQNRLLREAFTLYDRQRTPDEPTAEQLAKNCSSAQEQREFLNDLAIQFLRYSIAKNNAQFTKLVAETRSLEIKRAGINMVYDTIRRAYPGIHHEAEAMRDRELSKLDGTRSDADALPPAWKPAQPQPVNGSDAEVAAVSAQARQVANLAYLALQAVQTTLVPAAAAAGCPLDAQMIHSLSMSVLIELCRQKAYYKLPSTPLK